jgi:hypothetical protein
MSVIKYFVLPDNREPLVINVSEPWGFADAIINTGKDAELKEFCEKNQVDYGHQCDKINTFVWNGFTYYCSAKTAQAVEKKFKIDRVVTDREQLKENREKEKEIRQEMRSDEWLADKVTADCAELLNNGLKRYKFVQEVRDRNPDIAHTRMTRQIQKMFEEEWLAANDKGIIVAGKNFPRDKLVTKKIVEEKDLYGRVRKRAEDTTT